MDKIKILWADDEIDLLKPQLLFLEKKGYEVITVTSGYDAVDVCKEDKNIEVVFLDESMPGPGLETLEKIKQLQPTLPVVMVTKNEAEDVMESALGAEITDYLIKPVKPTQLLLTLKKIIDNKRLIREKTNMDYQQEFRQLMMEINSGLDFEQWVEVYRKIINWELKIDQSDSTEMWDILSMQKQEANAAFSRFIERNYLDWIAGTEAAPVMSNGLLLQRVFPRLSKDKPTIVVLLDNLRYDQWKAIEPIISDVFRVVEEDYFYSILPTTTQYSRNAIFAGMMPLDIQKRFPDWWLNDNEKGGKNQYEEELLDQQIRRVFRTPIKFSYHKVTNVAHAKELQNNLINYLNNELTVVVYNFIDMLSHARTEMEVLKELAGDEKAYRSLTRSWFSNSPLWASLQSVAEQRDFQLIFITDHGTIRVNTPSRVIGDRETTTNLRYKVGRNLQYEQGDVLAIKDPHKAGLPRPNISSTFIFAKEDIFFLYPNNYNHYHNYYKNTFQHGGISLEEMICPIVFMEKK